MQVSQLLKTSVVNFYAMQKMRIQMGNRLVAAYRQQIGIEPSESEDQEDNQDSKDILNSLRNEYDRLADALTSKRHKDKFESTVFTRWGELQLVKSYIELLDNEKTTEKVIHAEIESYPVYREFLSRVSGCGPMMSAIIICSYDINQAHTAAAMHKYAGLDVVIQYDENGEIVLNEGRCRKSHHLVDKTYINAKGQEVKTKGITFNPFLKTKLIGVLGKSFLTHGKEYKEVYTNYKNRLRNSPQHKDKTKAHTHNMATRYMIKRFLSDLYIAWRTLEGLPVRKLYEVEKLGLVHSQPPSELMQEFYTLCETKGLMH